MIKCANVLVVVTPGRYALANSLTPRTKNLLIAGIIGLIGFLILAIVLIALFVGLWIDSLFGQRGPITIILLVCSVPISLIVMVYVTLWLVKKLQLPSSLALPNDRSGE